MPVRGEAANANVLLLQVEGAEGSTSEIEKSDDVEMVDGDEDKENDAEFKHESDDGEGEEEKDDEAKEDKDEDEEGRARKW